MQKPILDEDKLPVVMEIIDRLAVIFDEEDFKNDDVIKEEISELENKLIELTGKNIEQCQPFQNYWAYTDLETVAKNILMPVLQKENLSDSQLTSNENSKYMLRDELIRIVKIFQNDGIDEVTNKRVTENQVADYMDFFDDNVSHEAGVELIFELEKYGLPSNATAEEIVDFALNRKE